jgi:hypothetical protein
MKPLQQPWRIEMTRKMNSIFLATGPMAAVFMGIFLLADQNVGLINFSETTSFLFQLAIFFLLLVFLILGLIPHELSRSQKYSTWLTEPVRKDQTPEPELEVGDWPSPSWRRRTMRKRLLFARSIGLLIED